MSSDDDATAMALTLLRCFLELDPISRAKILESAQALARQPKVVVSDPSQNVKLH